MVLWWKWRSSNNWIPHTTLSTLTILYLPYPSSTYPFFFRNIENGEKYWNDLTTMINEEIKGVSKKIFWRPSASYHEIGSGEDPWFCSRIKLGFQVDCKRCQVWVTCDAGGCEKSFRSAGGWQEGCWSLEGLWGRWVTGKVRALTICLNYWLDLTARILPQVKIPVRG